LFSTPAKKEPGKQTSGTSNPQGCSIDDAENIIWTSRSGNETEELRYMQTIIINIKIDLGNIIVIGQLPVEPPMREPNTRAEGIIIGKEPPQETQHPYSVIIINISPRSAVYTTCQSSIDSKSIGCPRADLMVLCLYERVPGYS
jgi:hypothetical protein